MDMTWFALVLLFILSLYCYLKWQYSYWKRLGIPSVPAIPFIGSQLVMSRKPIYFVEHERYQKYGRIYGHYEGMRPVLTVANPDLLRNILVKDSHYFVNRRKVSTSDPIVDSTVIELQNERWKTVRALVTPGFSIGKVKKTIPIFQDAAKMLCVNFSNVARAGKPIDVKRFFGVFVMDVISSAGFSIKVDSHNDPENKFVSIAKQTFAYSLSLAFFFFFSYPSFFKIFRFRLFAKESVNFYKDIVLQIIEDRRRRGQRRNDFLQLMIDVSEDFGDSSTNNKKGHRDEANGTEFKQPTHQRGLSQDEVLAQCLIYFTAGFDTTVITLSFASYLLALNPDCQERLIEEIDQTLSDNEGNWTYESIESMKYLDSVILETLRFFPAGFRIERTALADYDLGYANLKIPKGMIIVAPTYAIHRDPEFYPDPEKFDPDRFSPAAKAERNPYTYLPFGAGPRKCFGMKFALIEIKMCLVHLFSQFRVTPCSETQGLNFRLHRNIIQPVSVILGIEERSDKVC